MDLVEFKEVETAVIETFGARASWKDFDFVRFSDKIEMLLSCLLFWVIVTSEEEDEWFFWFEEELDGEDEDEEDG